VFIAEVMFFGGRSPPIFTKVHHRSEAARLNIAVGVNTTICDL
jgi:hypothetical protein